MRSDTTRLALHFIVGVDEGCSEVDEDVDDEHDVNQELYDDERIVNESCFVVVEGRLFSFDVFVMHGWSESSDVGSHDGCVHDQEEDDPIPYRFERTEVEDGPRVQFCSDHSVLWQQLRTQRENLKLKWFGS